MQFSPREKQIRNSNLDPSPDITFVFKNISKNLPQDANITNFDLSSVLIPILLRTTIPVSFDELLESRHSSSMIFRDAGR